MIDAVTPPGQQAPVGTTPAPTSDSSPAPGTPTPSPQPNGSAAPQSAVTPSSDPWAGLSPDNLSFVQGKKFSDMNAALASHRELQTAFSQKSATVDVPTDVAGYDWARPADADTFGYSDDFASAFKQGMLGGKVSKSAAQAAHDWFVGYAKDAATRANEARNTAIAQSKVTLTREWGPEDGPAFKRNVELSLRAVEQLGLGEHLVQSGAMTKTADGKYTVVNADVVKAYSKIGQAMFAEDSMYGSLATATNPFAKDSENMTLAGRMVKENPQMARQLIMQSGRAQDFAYLLSKLPA